MKSTCESLLRLLLIAFTLSLPTAAQDAVSTIEIDASRPANYTIPRTIFGSFLEPIGHSIYGGLWAEELQNLSTNGTSTVQSGNSRRKRQASAAVGFRYFD